MVNILTLIFLVLRLTSDINTVQHNNYIKKDQNGHKALTHGMIKHSECGRIHGLIEIN